MEEKEAGMDFSAINWIAVAACVVLSMVVGMFWYHPKTFFLIWWRGIGKTEKDVPGKPGSMAVTWTLTVISSLVQAVFMSLMVNALGTVLPGGRTALSGAMTGFMIWLGFIAPTYLVNKLFAGHGYKVWAIEAGNHLVNFLLFGAILGAWR
jgi:hypothetical protein